MPLAKIAVRPRILSSVGAICLMLLTSEVQAIVLISDFNGPGVSSAESLANPSFSFLSYGVTNYGPSSYTASFNGGTAVGLGTIGETVRLATTGVGTSAYLNLDDSGILTAQSGTTSQGGTALLVLDAGTGPLKPNISFGVGVGPNAGNPTVATHTNINFAGIPVDDKNLVLGGDIPRGVVFDGIAGSLFGAGTLEFAVFNRNDSSQFAYLKLDRFSFADLVSNPYVPFTGFDAPWAADPENLHFVSSTGNSADLGNIFQNAGAIVLLLSSNGTGVSNANGFNISLNSLYTHTPEPASLVIWSVFGAMSLVVAGRRRKSIAAADQPLSPVHV